MVSDVRNDKFLVLQRGKFDSEHDTEMLEDDPVNLGEAPRCDSCGVFIGMRPWLPPHYAELTLHGQEWGDFAFRGVVGEDFLISERAANLYESAGLSGLRGFEPVEATKIYGPKPSPPAYFHVSLARSHAGVDEARSTVRRSGESNCSNCVTDLDAIHGFVLDSSAWTGEDVFVAKGLPGVVLATERFRRFVEDHKLTNVRFTPTNAYSWDAYAPGLPGANKSPR